MVDYPIETIDDLSPAADPSAPDLFLIWQGGVAKKLTFAQHFGGVGSGAVAAAEAAAANALAAEVAAGVSADDAAASAVTAGSVVFTSSIVRYANRTAMKAVNAPDVNAVLIYDEVGYNGLYYWATGDYSTQVADDTLERYHVKATAIAATAGVWERVAGSAFTFGSNWLSGVRAGMKVSTGIGNFIVGYNAGDAVSGGDYNLIMGYMAGRGQTGNSNLVAIGKEAGENSTAGGAIFIGTRAGRFTTSAAITLAVGIEALYNNVTGNNNTVFGMGAAYAVTGDNNTVVGHDAAKSISANGGSAVHGKNAMYGAYGANNAVFGHAANGVATVRSTATLAVFGAYAGYNATGDGSVALGFEAGYDCQHLGVYLGHQAGKGDATTQMFYLTNGSAVTYLKGDIAAGKLMLGKTTFGVANAGVQMETTGAVAITRSGATPLIINRLTDDGTLISLQQATTEEGALTVSSTTVTLTGAHLTRWGQWEGKKPEGLMRGTILSNSDKMCSWLCLEYTDSEGNLVRSETDVPEGAKPGDKVPVTYKHGVLKTITREDEYIEIDADVFEEETQVEIDELTLQNGAMVKGKKTIAQRLQVFDSFPVVDAHGFPVLDKDGKPEVYRTERKERKRVLHKAGETFEANVEVETTVDAIVVERVYETLPKAFVSKTDVDRSVAGVYQGDDMRTEYAGDFFLATVGDYVVRLGEGVKVKNGDLICSAGNGTGRVQDDDVVRSSTVAKVTSTKVIETFLDGSYLVPCYLKAA